MRLTIRQSQNQMVKASIEATTKTYADIGVSLGIDAAKSVNYARELDRISSFKDSNSTVNLRLEMSQSGLADVQKASDALVKNLTALKGSQASTAITVTLQSSAAALSQLMDTGNMITGGEYLFSGVNTDVPPLTDRSATVEADIVTALNTYATGLSKPVSALTAAEIDTFMTSTVEPMFSAAAWTNPATGWSKASNQNMTSRISNSEVITSSTNANSDGMRYLAMATVMTNALMRSGPWQLMPWTRFPQQRHRLCGAGDIRPRDAGRASSACRRSASRRRTTLSMPRLTIINNKVVDLQGVDPARSFDPRQDLGNAARNGLHDRIENTAAEPQ
ncbi:flagellar hook-associated family protein [Rhizobium yanglingense]